MTAPHIIDPAGMLGEALSQASPDLMRSLLQHVINALLSAYVDTVCGAQWGQQDPQRHARHNGYRYRPLDTRVGTIDVAIPKLRSGTYFPRVVAATPQTLRKRLDHSGRPLLPSRSVYTPHGQARQNPGDHRTVQVPGLTYGNRPGRAHGSVPSSAPPRCRSFHLRCR